MKFIWSFVCLILLSLLLFRTSDAQPAQVLRPVTQLSEKLVLRLPYVNRNLRRLQNGKVIGFFKNPEALKGNPNEPDWSIPVLFQGTLLATDARGWVYFYDPVGRQKLVRVFNTQGREVRRWTLPHGIEAQRAAVTDSGVVWLSVNEEAVKTSGKRPGLPIIALSPGSNTPLIDWTGAMPSEIYLALSKALKSEGSGNIKPQDFFNVSNPVIYTGRNTVKILLYGSSGENHKKEVDISVKLTDRARNIKPFVFYDTWKTHIASLAPSGVEYHVLSDATRQHLTWSKKWLVLSGQKQKEPLLTRATIKSPNGWWQKHLPQVSASDQLSTQIDGVGNIYLHWSREGSAYYANRSSRFQVPGLEEIELNPPMEHALVVLNPKREVIGYLPWTSAFLGPQDNWIFPLPDGSGFYRQEFAEKELRIYFHPLPKT